MVAEEGRVRRGREEYTSLLTEAGGQMSLLGEGCCSATIETRQTAYT